MESKVTLRPPAWLVPAALAGFWIAMIRLIAPQWSLFEQYSYGWAVPFLCGYLLWKRWEDRPDPSKASTSVAIVVLMAFALLLLPTRIIVEANPIWRVGSWALAIEIVGITLVILHLAGGWKWLRHFGFAIVFFLVAIPWPSQPENAITQYLMRVNASIAVEILNAIGIAALQHGNVLQVASGMVGIDEACSGIRSLQATLMISLFFGEFYRLRTVRRVWLVIAGAALAFLCNVGRTLTLVAVCSSSGTEAMDRWHDPTGIAILVGCFTGLWFVAWKLTPRTNDPDKHVMSTSAAHRLPRWLSIGLPVWLVLMETGNAAWFGLRDQADPELTNWIVKWPEDKRGLREVEISPTVAAILRADEGRSMKWAEQDNSVWQVFYFRWGPAYGMNDRFRVQLARGHRPDICLPAAGLKQSADFGMKEFDLGTFKMPFHAMRYEDRGIPLHVYFCIWEDGTEGGTSNLRDNARSRLRAALEGSRSLKLRTFQLVAWGYKSEAEADAALLRTLKECVEPLELP